MKEKTNNFIRKLAYICATWFGSGRVRFMPGTVGSFVTLPFVALVTLIGGIWGVIAFALVFYFIGVYSVRYVLQENEHDPGFVVIDEVVGQSLTFVFVSTVMPSLWMFLIGFVAFRFFDIVKVWPACYFDKKVQNASGVMLDDVVAGLYASLVLLLIHTLI